MFPKAFFAKRATTIRAPIFAGVLVIGSSFYASFFFPFFNCKPYRIIDGLYEEVLAGVDSGFVFSIPHLGMVQVVVLLLQIAMLAFKLL